MTRPIAIDLYCGLGGWAEGFLATGYDVIGFDIERHDYGTGGYPGFLVLQNILTLHGWQFKAIADRLRVIVASPPCTEPSYRAMPWKRAKALNDAGPPHLFISLFEACFRIQCEASEACGRHIPLIVENVVGAQRWIGRAGWHFGSYYLWGDIPALMPVACSRQKFNPDGTSHGPGSWFKIADSKNRGVKSTGQNWNKFSQTGKTSVHWAEFASGVKGFTPNGEPLGKNKLARKWGSKSKKRKMASAMIAKIPFPLARHMALCFKP